MSLIILVATLEGLLSEDLINFCENEIKTEDDIMLYASYLRRANSYVGRKLGKLLQFKYITCCPSAHVILSFA